MSRLTRGFGAAFAPTLALVVLAGCGSGHKHATPPSTTTVSTIAASTTTAPGHASSSTSSSTAPSTTTSTIPASVTTSATTPAGGPRITAFTVSPATPVCNAPTMIQLQWTATGATAVDLSIDGQAFASYGGGPQTHLEYFACDRKPHTYTLTAHNGSSTATASKVVTGSTNAG